MFVRFTTRTPAGALIPCLCEHSIRVCDRHRQVAAESFVSDRNMTALADQLEREHLAVPHPSSIEIEFARMPKAEGVISVDSVKEHFKKAS